MVVERVADDDTTHTTRPRGTLMAVVCSGIVGDWTQPPDPCVGRDGGHSGTT